MASDKPDRDPEAPVLVGVIFTYESYLVGIPMVHIAQFAKGEFYSKKRGCLPEDVVSLCGKRRSSPQSELVRVDYNSIVCNPCALAVPESHWSALPEPYRDPLFRMQISKVENNDGDPFQKAVTVYQKSTLHEDWGDEHWFSGCDPGWNTPK